MRQRKYLTYNKEKIDQILPLIFNNDFDKEIQRIRKKYSKLKFIRNKKFEGFKIVRGNKKDLKKNEFEDDIKYILVRFNLHAAWDKHLRSYILFNEIYDGYDPDGVVLEIETNINEPKKISLLLHERITLKDVRRAWSHIQKELIGAKDKKRKGRPSEFYRNHDMLRDFLERGLSESDIARKFNIDDVKIVENSIRKLRKILKK